MHQRLQRSCDIAVVDKEILFDIERRVAAFEITGTIIFNAMPQDQILRAGGSTNRIGLHEAHALQGAIECCRFREIPRDRESPQVVDSDRHRTRISGFSELTGLVIDSLLTLDALDQRLYLRRIQMIDLDAIVKGVKAYAGRRPA